MERVLYITYVDYLQNAFPGVQDKITGQIQSFREVGYEVDRINQYGSQAQVFYDDGKSDFISSFQRRVAILKAVKYVLQKSDYIAAYIRFQFFSEDVREMLHLLHEHNCIVLMEFPTFPYEGELHKQGLKGEIKLLCDKLFRSTCAENIDAFVTQAEDSYIYGTRCIKVLNGLDYSKHPLRTLKVPATNEVHCVAVASMLPWHGYDRFILGMADYYNKNLDINLKVFLHLVGDGVEIQKYQKIVVDNNLKEYVFFHGMQGGKSLENIVSNCDIAIGSLGAFRINLKKLSTLKSREYCAWGFPTVNCTSTDIIEDNDPYCLFVPEDESNVNIDEVVKFYKKVYFESGEGINEIARKIRSNAEQISDIRKVFTPVISFIKDKVSL